MARAARYSWKVRCQKATELLLIEEALRALDEVPARRRPIAGPLPELSRQGLGGQVGRELDLPALAVGLHVGGERLKEREAALRAKPPGALLRISPRPCHPEGHYDLRSAVLSSGTSGRPAG